MILYSTAGFGARRRLLQSKQDVIVPVDSLQNNCLSVWKRSVLYIWTVFLSPRCFKIKK